MSNVGYLFSPFEPPVRFAMASETFPVPVLLVVQGPVLFVSCGDMQKGVQPIKQDKLSKCQQPDATS